jgi:PAS domain S-box-containing protein
MFIDFLDTLYNKYLSEEIDVKKIFEIILEKIIEVTESKYGFVGTVMFDENNNPYLKSYSLTDISWNEETQKLYKENIAKGLEFRNLNTLFGWVMVNKKPLLTNDAINDPRAGGIPKGHPALDKFMGIPFIFNDEIIGMLGLANREAGYDDAIYNKLQPFIQTCTLILSGVLRNQLLKELKEKNKKNELLLQKITQHKSDFIVEIDAVDYTITDFLVINKNALLRQPDSFSNKKLSDLFPAELFEKLKSDLKTTIQLGEYVAEFDNEIPSLGKKSYRAYASYDKERAKISIAITEITKEKNYERLLLDQQKYIDEIKNQNYIGNIKINPLRKNIIESDFGLNRYFKNMAPEYSESTVLNYFSLIKKNDSDRINILWQEILSNSRKTGHVLFNCIVGNDSLYISVSFFKISEEEIEVKFFDSTSSHILDISNKKLLLKYEALLDNLEDIVIITDDQFNIIDVNKSFIHKIGIDNEYVLGKNIHDFISTENIDIENALHSNYDRIIEGQIILKDKLYCLIKKTKFTVSENDSLFQYVITDLSDYAKAKEELSNTTQTLVTIINNLHYGILFESHDGIIKHVNDKFLKYFNIYESPKKLINTACFDLLKDLVECFEYPEMVFIEVNKILEERRPVFNDFVPIKNNKLFQRDYIPIIDNGKYLGHLWIYDDITNTKEQELKLIENEQRLQLAISASNDGFWDWDLIKDTVYFSPRWKSMLGYTENEIENTIEAWGNLIFPDDKKNALEMLDKYIKGELPEFRLRQKFIHKKGTIVHVLSKAVIIRDSDGKAIRIVGAHTDITSSINNEINLLKQKEKAERSEKIMQQFLSNISHEMRTPLNSIIGYLNLLNTTNLNAKQSDYINDLKFSSVGLLKLINDILDLGKIQSGTLIIEEEVFNLKEHLKNVVSHVKNKAAEKNLKLFTDFDLDFKTYVISDKVRLNQILVNILINAIKFTEQGYVNFSVKISNTEDEVLYVKFNIEDSGIGISKENQSLIFEDFYQVSDKKNYSDGVGLGLSIVKKIITTLGGSISIKSTLGLGSNFEIILPLKIASQELIDSKEKVFNYESILTADEQTGLSMLKVLVVEDNPMSLKVFKEFLNSHNINCSHAVNGEEAVKMVSENNYDIVFMDYQMPVLDGIEATKIIRNLPDVKKSLVPIVALSAAVFKDDKEKFYNCGMNFIIEKPYSEESVFTIFKELFKINSSEILDAHKPDNKLNSLKFFNIEYFKNKKISKSVALELLEMYDKSIKDITSQFSDKQDINHFEKIRFTNHDIANSFLALGLNSLYNESVIMSKMLSGKIECSKEDKINQWFNILQLSTDSLNEISTIEKLLK